MGLQHLRRFTVPAAHTHTHATPEACAIETDTLREACVRAQWAELALASQSSQDPMGRLVARVTAQPTLDARGPRVAALPDTFCASHTTPQHLPAVSHNRSAKNRSERLGLTRECGLSCSVTTARYALGPTYSRIPVLTLPDFTACPSILCSASEIDRNPAPACGAPGVRDRPRCENRCVARHGGRMHRNLISLCPRSQRACTRGRAAFTCSLHGVPCDCSAEAGLRSQPPSSSVRSPPPALTLPVG